jgi:hypothetical protein
MIYKVYTNYDAMTLRVTVSASQETDVRLIVRDSEQMNTILTNRVRTILGEFSFYVRMPLCRKYVDVIIEAEGGGDGGLTLVECKKLPLERRLDVVDFNRAYYLNEFVTFVERFAYNAGVLRTNDINNPKDYYVSSGQHFYIKYLPVIVDYATGEELSTPARISNEEPIIEVSQRHVIGYTVPMILATLMHEYSHKWMNEDPDDESEADINGLFIYLGLGYPRIEAAEAWCEIFMQADTEENIERIAIIQKFIDEFEEKQLVLYN